MSCTCCIIPGDCCLYPAQALSDGLYSEDDLPDAVELINIDLVDSLEMTRSGAEYSGVYFGYTYKIALGNDELTPDQKYWAVSVQFGGGSFSQVTESTCLITYPYPRPENFSGIKDQFADSYAITINGGITPRTATVTRVSLCEWVGPGPAGSGDWSIFYISNPLDAPSNFLYRWLVDAGGALRYKIGPSNTPAGNYELAFQGETSVTVS